jgi:hypothetical protein
MRRATLGLLAALALLFVFPRSGSAVNDQTIDGTLMVDFAHPPNFKVGSWVRYHTVANSKLGFHRDYQLTLLVAGEEDMWGDRCFWLETWTQSDVGEPNVTASLISYSAFGDTAAKNHATWFIRKMVTGAGAEKGEAETSLWTRDNEEIRRRKSELPKDAATMRGTTYDTLGVDTVAVPRGSWRGPVVRERNRIISEVMKGDSTYHQEREELRTRKLAWDIPITHMVREDVVDTQNRLGWITGHSTEAKNEELEKGLMQTIVMDYGSGGLESRAISVRLRMPIDQQKAREGTAAVPSKKSKKTPTAQR